MPKTPSSFPEYVSSYFTTEMPQADYPPTVHISHFPTEILQRVFLSMIHPPHRIHRHSTTIEARAVLNCFETCKRWHDVLLNLPDAWGAILQLTFNATLWDTVVQRARGRAVSLIASTSMENTTPQVQVRVIRNFGRFLNLVDRWEYVHIHHSGEEPWDRRAFMRALRHPGPRLRLFTFDWFQFGMPIFTHSLSEEKKTNKCHNYPPSPYALEKLQFSGPAAYHAASLMLIDLPPHAFLCLTHLVLHGNRGSTFWHYGEVSPTELADFLRPLVNLQTVSLQGIIKWTEPQVYTSDASQTAYPPAGSQPVSLPFLRNFNLKDELFCCSRFVSMLSLPPQCTSQIHCGSRISAFTWDSNSFTAATTSLLNHLPTDIEVDTLSVAIGNAFTIRMEHHGTLKAEVKAQVVRYLFRDFGHAVGDLYGTVFPSFFRRWPLKNVTTLRLKVSFDAEKTYGLGVRRLSEVFYQCPKVETLHLHGVSHLAHMGISGERFQPGYWVVEDPLPRLRTIVVFAAPFIFSTSMFALHPAKSLLCRILRTRLAKKKKEVPAVENLVIVDDVTDRPTAPWMSSGVVADRVAKRTVYLGRDVEPHFPPHLKLKYSLIKEEDYLAKHDTGYRSACSYCAEHGSWFAPSYPIDSDLTCDCKFVLA